MRIDGNQPYAWDEINGFCHRVLGLENTVQVFRGVSHALFEVTLGLHLKFSHKRKIVAQFGMGSHMHRTQMELAKLGVRFKDSFEDDLTKEKKAVLAAIFDCDDALSGAVYDRSDVLGAIKDLGMYRVFVSHFGVTDYRELSSGLAEHDIHIVSLNPDFALALLGKNCQLTPLSASVLPWTSLERQSLVQALSETGVALPADLLEAEALSEVRPRSCAQNIDAVCAFEKQLDADNWQLWFDPADKNRRFDRAVAVLKKHDGEAFVHLFHEMFAESAGDLSEPGHPSLLETTSYSRWGNPLWLGKAERWGRSPEELRGMVSFSLEFIGEPENQKRMKVVLSELRSLSC